MSFGRKFKRDKAMRRLERRAALLEPPEMKGEREKLMVKLRKHVLETNVKDKDPMRFLAYLRQQRRGYDPGRDGPSELMSLVDDFDALDAESVDFMNDAVSTETVQ